MLKLTCGKVMGWWRFCAELEVEAVAGRGVRSRRYYGFANERAKGMQVLVQEGIGVRRAERRLSSGEFVWS